MTGGCEQLSSLTSQSGWDSVTASSAHGCHGYARMISDTYIRAYVHLLGEELDFNSWNNVFARWRLQQLRDTQKHTHIRSNLLYTLHLHLHLHTVL